MDSGTGASGTPRTARLGAAALLLAASVFLSRVIGYLREVALANQVGAGRDTDAYYAAFQIPDLLNYLLAGGALAIAFIPFYTRVAERDGERGAEQLLATVLGTLGVAAVVATGLLWAYADALIALQFPGFDAGTQALAARLTRIVLPGQIFFVTGGILRAVLMARGRFGAQAAAPLLYNSSVIAGGLATGTAEGFAWGVLVGAFLGNWLVPLFQIRGEVRLRLRFAPLTPYFRTYLWIALPLMIGLSLTTVDEWYERWFGAALGPGSVAALGFARRLMMAPVAVVGQAIAAAALPTLTRLWNQGRREELDRTLLHTLQASVCVAVLAGAACWALAEPLVAVVYRHGRFGAEDAVRVAAILAVLSFAVPGWVTQQVAVRAFYAREETWRPMLLATAVALAAIPLYLTLGRGHGVQGLAAAGAIAMTLNALATLGWSRLRFGAPRLGAFFDTAARSFAIAAPAAAAAQWLVSRLAPPAAGLSEAVWQLLAGGAVLVVLAAAGVHWFGDTAMRQVEARLAARLPWPPRCRGGA